jgi:predicted GH43/DUF377 family glycosyl hydrolase
MIWQKLGRVWEPVGDKWWNYRYAMLPVPVYLEDQQVIRVFFGSADRDIFSRVSFVDLDPSNPTRILGESQSPVLDIGDLGTFDDSGVVPSCALRKDGKLYLYTVGFQRCVRVPYMLFAGLAESSDNGLSFTRSSRAPILPRNDFRPTSQGAPSVLFHEGKYKMWHWFSTRWIDVGGKLFLDYKIGYAESADAVHWEMRNITCLSPDESKGEFAVARPWVILENGRFRMWYSIRFRGKMYRIGYAESSDGISWDRLDHLAGIDVSQDGWDSEMVCYPALLDIRHERYLFYNGNNNGATGFGVARLELDN